MDRQAILRGTLFSLDNESGVTFLVEDRNWNDYGYYTWYTLQMFIPNVKYSYRIADFRVISKNQEVGDKAVYKGTANPTIFIANIESAERMFLMLTPTQRQKLEELLSIDYDCNPFKSEPVFQNSVLRGYTISEFIEAQNKIKRLMHSEINARSFLGEFKSQICNFLNDLQD